jgi:hypothetical protein
MATCSPGIATDARARCHFDKAIQSPHVIYLFGQRCRGKQKQLKIHASKTIKKSKGIKSIWLILLI